MTALHGVDLDALTSTQRKALTAELFNDEVRKRVAAAVEIASLEAYEDADDHRGHPDPMAMWDALHAWHEAYHQGAFRLCREPQCRDLGFGTRGGAQLQLAVAG